MLSSNPIQEKKKGGRVEVKKRNVEELTGSKALRMLTAMPHKRR